MVDLSPKRRMAAEVLGVGTNRIKFDVSAGEALDDAITRGSIRALIKEGVIWTTPKKGISRGRVRITRSKPTKRGTTSGSREGAKFSRRKKKMYWMLRVRGLRSRLRTMKDRGEITNEVYWKVYRMLGGGQVRSRKHMAELIASYGKR